VRLNSLGFGMGIGRGGEFLFWHLFPHPSLSQNVLGHNEHRLEKLFPTKQNLGIFLKQFQYLGRKTPCPQIHIRTHEGMKGGRGYSHKRQRGVRPDWGEPQVGFSHHMWGEEWSAREKKRKILPTRCFLQFEVQMECLYL